MPEGMNGYSGHGQTQFLAGETAAASLMQSMNKGAMRGIGLAVAVIAEFVLKKKAIDLAKDYYKTNKKDYDFFESTHQPAIGSTANEAFSALNPSYNEDTHASVLAGVAKVNKVDKQWYEARIRIPKYNVGQQRRLDYDMAVIRAHTVAAGWNAGIRYEMSWADSHNKRAFNRKVTVANIGVGIGNIVREGQAASVTRLSTAYDVMGDTVASIGNGYAAYSGANDARQQVKEAVNPHAKQKQT